MIGLWVFGQNMGGTLVTTPQHPVCFWVVETQGTGILEQNPGEVGREGEFMGKRCKKETSQ